MPLDDVREQPAMMNDHAANQQSMSESIPDMESFVSSELNEEEMNAQLELVENSKNKDGINPIKCIQQDLQSADDSEEQ